MKSRWVLFMVVAGLFCVMDISMAAERAYPTKPIDLIVGFAPGAGADLGTRLIAENSKKSLGQEVVIQNKPGGGGRSPYILVAKSTPDGYTLGGGPDATLMVAPFTKEKVSYKIEDFTFIAQYGVLNYGIVVRQDSPIKSFKDLVAFARANPDTLTVGTLGEGSAGQMAFEILARTEGLKIKLVPFSGAAPALTALLGGHLMATSTGSSGYSQHVKAGSVRVLAGLGEERGSDYPDLPTAKESGFPLLVFQNFYVLYGPKNMEKSIVQKLGQAFLKAMEAPDFIKLAKDLEIYVKKPLAGDELTEREFQRYRKNEEIAKKLVK